MWQLMVSAPVIYFPYGFCTNKDSYCSNFLVLYLQVYASQEAETLAVHSLFTMQNTEALKRNLRNVQKRRVFAQRVTYIKIVQSASVDSYKNYSYIIDIVTSALRAYTKYNFWFLSLNRNLSSFGMSCFISSFSAELFTNHIPFVMVTAKEEIWRLMLLLKQSVGYGVARSLHVT